MAQMHGYSNVLVVEVLDPDLLEEGSTLPNHVVGNDTNRVNVFGGEEDVSGFVSGNQEEYVLENKITE